MILIIMLLLLSISDVSLTYLYFFMMNKKGCFILKEEKSLFFRLLLSRGFNEYIFLFGLCIPLLVFIFINYFFSYLVPYFIGVLFMINIYHINNIMIIHKFWNNNKYWKAYKIIKGLNN